MSTNRANDSKGLKGTIFVAILALSLTAQSCTSGSGPRGVWKSQDAAVTWQKVNLVSVNKKRTAALDSLDVKSLSVASNRSDVLYASTPSGVFATDNGGKLWYHVLPRVDVESVQVSRSDPAVVYAVGSLSGRGAVYKSVNYGKDWEQKYIDPNENIGWSVSVNPGDSNDVLVGFESGLLLSSRNGGESWRVVQSFRSRVQSVKFNPGDSRQIFVLLRSDGLLLSHDGGNSFTKISEPLTRSILSDVVSPSEFVFPSLYKNFDFPESGSSVIYLTTDTGLFRTLNSGSSWALMRLPVEPRGAKTVALEAVSGGSVIYVSIDTVVFRSIDGGRTFTTSKLPTERTIRSILALPDNPDTVYLGLTR